MERLTTTPFGRRPITAALIKNAQEACQATTVAQIDKWAILRDLCTARKAFGISDRDLAVLNALVSFHPGNMLVSGENLIVFPSNRSLAERAHGMAESTLRRHLANLCDAGLIQRHDSPNGKRYASRRAGGTIARAFGFDLRPLLVRAQTIAKAADDATQAANRIKRKREAIIVMRRDAMKLCSYGRQTLEAKEGHQIDWHQIEEKLLVLGKTLRRKLPCDVLDALYDDAKMLMEAIHNLLETPELSGNDIQNERHHQNSQKDSSVFEPVVTEPDEKNPANHKRPNIPLPLLLKACPDIRPYANEDIRHWHQLVAVARYVRSMMGISEDAWEQAQKCMGAEVAATTVIAILQRIRDIKSPGGYLRSLTRKAAEGAFSPGPMVMALLNAKEEAC